MIGIICTLAAVLLLARIHEYVLLELVFTLAILGLSTNVYIQEFMQEHEADGAPIPRRYTVSKSLIGFSIFLLLVYAVYLNSSG
ncbi:MAG: hypothetical protein ACRBB4_16910 [Neptuniibacter sp.]